MNTNTDMYYQNYYNVNDITNVNKEEVLQKNLTNVTDGFRRGNIFTNLYWPYKKQMYNFSTKNDRQRLMIEIMENSFYAHELKLYLDNFPNDKDKIDLYNKYSRKTTELTMEYNNKYEPITLLGNEMKEVPWAWEDSPWPWEGV
jgi:spore coat protein JB